MADLQRQQRGRAVDETDIARAQEYTLLSRLLLRSPDADLLVRLRRLSGDESALGRAHQALAESAARTSAEAIAREYFALFVGLGRGELLPYASYYLTGFVHGRPLVALRQDLQRLGIERSEGQSEPEDHAGILLEVMGALSGGIVPAPAGAERAFFHDHLAAWIGAFFSDLERAAESAQFYSAVGRLGTTFLEIERQGFQLTDSE
jgi:TorA maturation chaperone TorD